NLASDFRPSEAVIQASHSVGHKSSLREQAHEADQKPVAVDGRMPVVTTKESRRQLPRRFDVGIRVQRVRDFVRVFFVNTSKGKRSETLGLCFVKLCFVIRHGPYGRAPAQRLIFILECSAPDYFTSV